MERLQQAVNKLYIMLEGNLDVIEYEEYKRDAIELLSQEGENYGSYMASEELMSVVYNIENDIIEDSLNELEIMINEMEI